MNYRTLGRTNIRVSEISLGTEYLIDIPRQQVVDVIRKAIDKGINYFDVFWAQPEFRDNMGAAFAGERNMINLAAHLGAARVDGQYKKTRNVKLAEEFFTDFLKRYQTDHADILFLHNSDGQKDYDKIVKPGGLLELAVRLQKEGKTRFIGFSGHTVSTAKLAAENPNIQVVMYPINLTGHGIKERNQVFEACVANNTGLVAMKPYAGGKLLQKGRTVEVGQFQRGGEKHSLTKKEAVTAAQCLAYVLAQKGVSTVVPGPANLEQFAAIPGYYTASQEERDFSSILSSFQEYVQGECVYCNHCLPCPVQIDIGMTNRLLDLSKLRGINEDLRGRYAGMKAPASACTECDACTKRCPFGVNTMEQIKEAAKVYEG